MTNPPDLSGPFFITTSPGIAAASCRSSAGGRAVMVLLDCPLLGGEGSLPPPLPVRKGAGRAGRLRGGGSA